MLREIQILGSDHTHEFDNNFTTQELKTLILRIKNNKATACDSVPAEAWKTLLTTDEMAEILTKLFNVIINRRHFPKERKAALTQPIYTGNGNTRNTSRYREISLLQTWGKYIQE